MRVDLFDLKTTCVNIDSIGTYQIISYKLFDMRSLYSAMGINHCSLSLISIITFNVMDFLCSARKEYLVFPYSIQKIEIIVSDLNLLNQIGSILNISQIRINHITR